MKDWQVLILVIIASLSGALAVNKLNHTDDTNGVAARDGYTLVDMDVSAYCACEKCCGKWADGVTASGVPAEGFIVAAPARYPFGTIMDITGYGVASVQDRGGAITGDKIDLLFSSHQKALEWGRRLVTVKVYNSLDGRFWEISHE
jgi:3D (Asp-Asp-Asp) domain-containing protein